MWLASVFIGLFVVNVAVITPLLDRAATDAGLLRSFVLPVFGVSMLLCGFTSGAVGLVSIIKDGERSWVTWLTLLPMAAVTFFVLGEFLAPH